MTPRASTMSWSSAACCEDQDYDPRLLAYLRQAAAAGVALVGLCTGVFALARAGVLDGYRCCVHGYHLPDFRARFPRLQTVSDQISWSTATASPARAGSRPSTSSATSWSATAGPSAPARSCPTCSSTSCGPAYHPQLLLLDDFFTVYDERVRAAVFVMQQHIGNPISVDAIARRVGVPTRQLERGFQRSFPLSPSGFFRLMRLRRARWLVLHSTLRITQIAIDCGFADTAHLTRSFKREYGQLPTELRRSRRRSRRSPPSPDRVRVAVVQNRGSDVLRRWTRRR